MKRDSDGFYLLRCRRCRKTKPISLFAPSSIPEYQVCIECTKGRWRAKGTPSMEVWREGTVWNAEHFKWVPIVEPRK